MAGQFTLYSAMTYSVLLGVATVCLAINLVGLVRFERLSVMFGSVWFISG